MIKRLFDMPGRVFWWVLGISLLARFLFAASGIEITADTVSYQISALGLMREVVPGFALEDSPNYPVYVIPQLLQLNASDFMIERTPGYPLWMLLHAGLFQTVIQGVLTTDTLYRSLVFSNSLLGVLMALMSAELCWRVFRQPAPALAAGLLIGLSPNLLGTEHVVLSEPLYAFSLLTLLLLFTRWSYEDQTPPARAMGVGIGLLSGWLLWVKPIGLVVILAVAAFLWLNKARHQLPGFLIPITLMIALWMGFQYQVHGGFLGYTAGGGMNQLYKVVNFMDMDSPLHGDLKAELQSFARTVPPENAYMGVNAIHTGHLQQETAKPPGSRRAVWQIYLEEDVRARAIAQEAILKHPGRYLQMTLQQIPRTWLGPTFWDKHLIYWSPVLVLGLLGMALHYREQTRNSPGFLLSLILVGHILFYSLLTMGDPRYRIPLEPLFIIFAVFAAQRLYEAHRQVRQ